MITALVRQNALLWLAGLLGALLLTGPAMAQDAVTIAQARSALEAARSTRAVRALAAPQLDMAELALERALAALDADQPRSEVEHLAYLAERRAAIARTQAEEQRLARTLSTLSATHAMILETRALEAAAAEQRARELAQRLRWFDVRADEQGLLLTPREPWFETDLAPARRAVRAIAEAAGLLGELPDRQVLVLGYAAGAAQAHGAVRARAAAMGTTPARPPVVREADADLTLRAIPNRDDLGCARADVVRAFLISKGVDPRRIVATCLSPLPGSAASAAVDQPAAGETAIAIRPEGGSSRTSPIGEVIGPVIGKPIDPGPGARRLSAGAATR